VNHRRYEALRAFFVDGATHAEFADRFGYTRGTMVALAWIFHGGGRGSALVSGRGF
jgi:hypothetical protein